MAPAGLLPHSRSLGTDSVEGYETRMDERLQGNLRPKASLLPADFGFLRGPRTLQSSFREDLLDLNSHFSSFHHYWRTLDRTFIFMYHPPQIKQILSPLRPVPDSRPIPPAWRSPYRFSDSTSQVRGVSEGARGCARVRGVSRSPIDPSS
jgi:hypothetical protein